MIKLLHKLVEPVRNRLGIRKELFETVGRRVLDVGSGQYSRGNLTLDRDPDVRSDVTGKGSELPYSTESMDEVVCYHLVEHLSLPDFERLLSEVRRVLVQDGSAHLLVDRGLREEVLLEKDPDHERRYSPEIVRRISSRYFSIDVFQMFNLIGNINKHGPMFWRYLNRCTKIYLELVKGSD